MHFRGLLVTLFFANIWIQSDGKIGLGLKEANECRRVSQAARLSDKAIYTARCRLMSSETKPSKFSLRDSVPPAWAWTLDHKSIISGQVIVSDHNSVYMISQKQCIDTNKSRGRQIRRLYYESDRDANLSYNNTWTGDLYNKIYEKNVYAGCAKSNTTWNNFEVIDERRMREDNNTKQFVIFRNSINAFDFNYTTTEIQKEFENEINKIEHNKRYNNSGHKKFTPSQNPIVLQNYPGKTGLSILASSNNILNGKYKKSNLQKDLKQDASFVAWNRALQAKSALADKSSSHFSVVEPPELLESIQLIIELIVAAGFTSQAYNSAMSVKPLGNAAFMYHDNSWQIIRDQADFGFQGDWYNTSYDLIFEFGGALAALVIGFKTVYDSNWWRRTRLLVTQGGLVTYGEKTRVGTVFYISHWYSVKILKEGYIWVNGMVWSIVVFLFLLLLYSIYRFSVSRQVKLHIPLIQGFVRIVHVPVEATLTILGRILPDNWSILNSYEKQFKSTCDRLCTEYFRSNIKCKNDSTLLGRVELKAHKEKNENIFMRPWYGAPSHSVTRNDIEKASEILAADAHGRLSYFQALAIMSDVNLTEAADRFNRDENCFLSVQDIKHLAMVYYVDGLFVPCANGNGFSLDSFTRVKSSDGIHDITKETTILSPIIQGGRIKEYAIIDPSGQEIAE